MLREKKEIGKKVKIKKKEERSWEKVQKKKIKMLINNKKKDKKLINLKNSNKNKYIRHVDKKCHERTE